MNAIVYTSNSGFTAQYAAMLGDKLNLPVYDLKDFMYIAKRFCSEETLS